MHIRLFVAVAVVLLGTTAPYGADSRQGPPRHDGIEFTDVAAEAGLSLAAASDPSTHQYIVDTNGNGAAFFDYDNDGHMDLLIVRGSTLERLAVGGDPMVALFRNDGRGRFVDVTTASGMTRRGWGSGVCVADVDNDGFRDVYVTAFGPNVLWLNRGNGTFRATRQAADPRWSTGCAFGDYDRDGFVDLYVANYLQFDPKTIPARGAPSCRFMNIDAFCGPRPFPGQPDALYRNVGGGRFVDATKVSLTIDPGYYGLGVLFTDLNDDGWPDIYVANDSVPNLFFRNRGDGTFAEEALLAGLAVSGDGREQASMGVAAGDYDGDGRLDVLTTNFAQDYTSLYRNEGDGLFTDSSYRSGLASTLGPYLGWGTAFVDVDNDGLLDIFIANGHVFPDVRRTGTSTYRQNNQLFRNEGGGRFRHVTDGSGSGFAVRKSSRGAASGDYDNDGDIDILVTSISRGPTLLRNATVSDAHWITLRLRGVKSNRDAIGARVTIDAGGRRQIREVSSGGSYLSHNDMRIHFGLGDAPVVDRLTVRWPSGLVETVSELEADAFYVMREGNGARRR